MCIEFSIDELVLDGFPYRDRYLIAEAMERELAALLAEKGAPSMMAHGGDFSRLEGGAFAVQSGFKAETIGAQAARAVFGSLTR